MTDRRLMTDHDLLIRIDERMEVAQDHLEKINGRLEKGEDRMDATEANVKVLCDRWKWVKWAAGGGVVSGLGGLGAYIKSIVGN